MDQKCIEEAIEKLKKKLDGKLPLRGGKSSSINTYTTIRLVSDGDPDYKKAKREVISLLKFEKKIETKLKK